MLSIKDIGSSGEAGKYYSKADYYTKGEENVDVKSQWFGKGAEMLGLNGEIDPKLFAEILEGKLPNGQQLGRMLNGEMVHKPGWDLTLSAPKSISILALIGGDRALMDAHHEAVKEALSFVESQVLRSQTMTDEGHAYLEVPNSIVAQFTHTTNRTQDPQLHTHNVVMNAAATSEEQWRSVYSRDLYNSKMLVGLVYRSKLAELSKELGYTPVWDNKKGTFELSEISQEHIDLFSQRRAQIEAYAEAHGLSTAEEMAEAATNTRAPKKDTPTQTILENWDQRAKESGMDFEQLVNEKREARGVETSTPSAGPRSEIHVDSTVSPKSPKVDGEKKDDTQASDTKHADENTDTPQGQGSKPESNNESHSDGSSGVPQTAYEQLLLARDILAHNEQAFSSFALIEATLKYSGGRFSIKDVLAAQDKMIEQRLLLPSSAEKGMLTTQEAINRELNVLDNIERGKGKFKPLGSDKDIAHVEDVMSFTQSQSKSFSDITRSTDKYIGLQGFAGTGKTYLAAPIAELARKGGYDVKGMAPNGKQAENLGNELGIQSQTVKSFLVQAENEKIKLSGKQLWVVDETTLLNARDTEMLVRLANQSKGVRVLFIGDDKQLGSIEAGRIFSTMMKGGMAYTTNNDIIRQQDKDYLSAVQAFTRGEINSAFEKLEKFTHERPDTEGRFQAFTKEYMEHFDKTGKLPMAVVPNKEGEAKLATMIRHEMRERGVIKGEEHEIKSLVPGKVDGPQKSHAQFYSEGMIVKFNRRFEGIDLKRGEYVQVAKVVGDTLKMEVKSENGDVVRAFDFNPSKYAMKESDLTAYRERPISIAEGDKIVWKDKNNKQQLLNGSEGTVKSIKDGVMTVDFGKRGERALDLSEPQNRHFQHNYSQTAFAAQGLTSQKNMMMAESWRRNLVTQPSLYVGVSRGKYELSVYTDNAQELRMGVLQRNGKNSEGVEHLTSHQAQQIRQPEMQHRTFLDVIGFGDKDKFKTYSHEQVFHEPKVPSKSEPEHRSAPPKPQHEKTR